MLKALMGLIVRRVTVPNLFALQRLGGLRYEPGHTFKTARREGGGHSEVQSSRGDGANLDIFMMTESVRTLFWCAHHCADRQG
jgi:hypothetical protein